MFHFDDKEMAANLFAFDEHLGGEFDDLLVLRLENNSIVSLHDNLAQGTAQNIDVRNGKQTSSRHITSNAVVVGDNAWKGGDPVRRVQFSIEHADELLRNSARFEAIADAKFDDMPDTGLCELPLQDMTIKVGHVAYGNLSFKRPRQIGLRYEITFDEPRDLNSYMPAMLLVVQFISAALGHAFAPSDICISRLTSAEMIEAISGQRRYRDHRLFYVWPVKAPEETMWIGRAFAHARNDQDLAILVDCLRVWAERDGEWGGATTMMMGALSLQNVMSGERLLNACNWLEEIPGAASEMAVSDEDIAAIAEAAAAEADSRGHAEYKPRVAGIIRSQLKKESNAERFARLRQSVVERFGETIGVEIMPHLLAAMQYRGRVAHGHFHPANGDDFQAFAKSIYAMEALCYLLTIKDLPMSAEGAERAVRQRIVTDYLRYPG